MTVEAMDVSHGWRYPRPVQSFASRLLTQQFWCLGQDVVSPFGNLLMAYGFARHPGPAGQRSQSTCYMLEQDQLQIALWAFGAVFARRSDGGLFLDRFNFKPCWTGVDTLPSGVHSPEQLPRFSRPERTVEWRSADRLGRSMLGWFTAYELWISERYGLRYRQQCVEKWSRPVVSGDQMAEAWAFLGNRCWDDPGGDWAVALTTFTQSTSPLA